MTSKEFIWIGVLAAVVGLLVASMCFTKAVRTKAARQNVNKNIVERLEPPLRFSAQLGVEMQHAARQRSC